MDGKQNPFYGAKMNAETLGKMFNEYNQKHFNNELPSINIVIPNRMTSCIFGQYRFAGRRDLLTRTVTILRREIRIYRSAILANEVEQTLKHEMLHYYLHYKGLPCGHTPRFKAMLSSILGQTVLRGTVIQKIQQKPQVPVPSYTPSIPTPAPVPAPAPVAYAPVTICPAIGDRVNGLLVKALEIKNGGRIGYKLEDGKWYKVTC